MPNDQITEGISSALYAAIKGDDKELQKQLNSGNIKKTEKNQILAFAAANCGTEILKLMKDQGYDFSWKDSDKVGLIHIAALCNQKEVVEYLLDQGLNGCRSFCSSWKSLGDGTAFDSKRESGL